MKLMFKRIKIYVSAFCISLGFASCQDDMKEYYEEPNWLKGSIYEILQNDGNYDIFLKGVEMCDYTALIKGRSILTVMAPDDEAMRAYLQENYGTENIEEVDVKEVKKLIGFHLLYYSFDKDMLVNFRPLEGDGATDDEKDVNAGLYYKFRTRSQEAADQVQPERLYQITDEEKGTGEIFDTTGVTVDVYHLERFIPVFSHRMFETKLIDAQYNYEYFFPETGWSGDNGFNVANANVTEYEVIAKNGYIYRVDRVIKPLETIHTELKNNPNYSQYLAMYDAYAYYKMDEELTNLYGGGSKTYYQRLYESGKFPIANIASEWPVSHYSDMATLSSVAYSIFAPTNEAFDEFYRSYWGDEGTGYPTAVCYDSVSADALGYLLSNSIYASSIVFPEEITNGEVENVFTKSKIIFDVDAVPADNRKMCVNGVLYGQSVLTPPAVFGSVTGPAYKYKSYSIFLKMLTASGMNSTLCSDAVNFIALYPSNAQFEANGIWYNPDEDKLKSGVVGNVSKSSNLGSATQSNFVNAHVVSLDGAAEPLSTSGVKVYRTLSTNGKVYWYVKDGKITNCFKYNNLIEYSGHTGMQKDSVYTDVQELLFRGASWSNGHCYEYDTKNGTFLLEGSNENAVYANFIPMAYAHINDEGTLFQGFIKVLKMADMIDPQAMTMNYQVESCMMLVPTTDAIKRAIVEGRFPYISVPAGTTADDAAFWDLCVVDQEHLSDLQHYLFEYFLPESTAPCANYPYPGWGEDTERDGGIPSIADMTVTPAASALLYIYDRGGKLTAKAAGMDHEVDFYDGYDYLPFVFNDGCVHFINDIFEDKWPKSASN